MSEAVGFQWAAIDLRGHMRIVGFAHAEAQQFFSLPDFVLAQLLDGKRGQRHGSRPAALRFLLSHPGLGLLWLVMTASCALARSTERHRNAVILPRRMPQVTASNTGTNMR